MHPSWGKVFLAAAWLAFSGLPLAAQIVTGSITGTVTDKSGRAMVDVTVTLRSEATAALREAKTDAAGDFQFNAIQAGPYTLMAEHPGFKRYAKQDIELTPGENLSLGSVKLQIGSVSETVTVQAEGAAVQSASGERSGVITSQEMENLTVMNRDFATLIALLPGVVDSPGTSEVQGFSDGASFNVAGNRSNGNSITIDGGSTENTNGGNGNNFVSMDSVQTVRIVTSNYQAEFGRKPAASIMAVTKNGTQKFHGAAYWYYRHEWMNANDFFNNRNGVAQTPRRVQTPGGNIGGPAYIPGVFNQSKSKLFFFTSLEFIKERRPQGIRNLTMPTARERAGDFSQSYGTNGKIITVNDPMNGKTPFPNNVIPLNRINPNGQNYLKLLPMPNGVNPALALFNYNYQVQESLDIPKVAETSRIDYILDEKTTIWFKFNWWREDQRGWAVSASNANWGWLPSHYLNYTYAPVVSITRIINPSTILEASIRMTRWIEDGSALNQSDLDRLNRKTAGFDVPQLYPGNNPLNLVPTASFGGISNGPTTSLNARFPLRGAESPMFADVTGTKTHGTHVGKLGFYAERWRAVKGESGNWNGTFDFGTDSNNPNDSNNAFANALLGNFKTYSESNSRPPLYEQTTSLEWFAQDNWKVNRRLTLDLGVRFGWSQPFYSSRRQEAGFVPSTWNPAAIIQLMTPVRIGNVRQAKDPITGALYPVTVIGAIAANSGDPYNGTVNLMTNLTYPHGLRENSSVKPAPRFGFAYDPFGDGKGVIRGGFGVFYENHEKDLWGYALHLDPPNQLTPQIYYGNLQTLSDARGFVFPSNTSGLDANRVLGRTMSYSFGFQRDVGWHTLVDAAYVGTLARHLLERKNINSIPYGTTFQASAQDPSNPGNPLAAQYLRPYLGYGDIQFYNYDANSSYHSLQMTVNRRFSKGLTGGAAWTWSKAMDYDDIDTTNLSALVSPKIWNYGKAGFDRTHILKIHYIWEMPRASRLLPDSHLLNPVKKAVLDGWQLSGITTFMSGAPTGITLQLVSGTVNNWSGSPTDASRVDVIANPVLPKSEQTFNRFFNTAAFALPAQGTPGNAAKDVFRGPGINNWDASLFKNFRLTERFKAQFRCEGYNAFNHTQFSSVDTNAKFDNKTGALANPTFGQFTGTRLARRMQLALRVTF